MKKEIRILGIDDAPFNKFKDRNTFIVGVVYRGGQFMDGVLSARIRVDGNNSTKKIAEMVNSGEMPVGTLIKRPIPYSTSRSI